MFRGRQALLSFALILSVIAISPSEITAHSGSDYVYSRWDTHAPVIDGDFNLTEWENSTLVDLRLVGSNTLDAYLYAKNNDTHLFIALDAVEDTTADTADTASISFDGDHNGAPTDNGDHEFTVKGDVDASCTGFTSTKCHYVYSQTTNRWRANDPMDQGLPYQWGLDGAIGFGNSSKSATEHRIYEFSVPIEMIGRPLLPLSIGDTVGFYVGRHPLPVFGVRDHSTGTFAYWPGLGLDPGDYGNLVLGTPADVALDPEFDTKPARPGEDVQYALKVRNTGNEIDSFDLQASSLQGWTVKFLDEFLNLLSNSGGNPAYPDVGPIMPGDYVNIVVEVTASASATEGVVDLTEVNAYPFRDALRSTKTILRTGVPYVAPMIDDLESGTSSWYVFPRPVNDWEIGTPTFPLGPASAHSGIIAIGTALDLNYSICSNSILYAPFMEIPDWVLGAKLTFWHWYDIVSNQQDGGWIETSVGGQPWARVTPVGGYPDTRWGGSPAYAGKTGGWVQTEVNLSAYVGEIVGLRFRFWDHAELIGPTPLPDRRAPGWYLDDFELSILGLPAAVSVRPSYQSKVGLRSTEVSYELFVMNVGQQSDAFDVMITDSTLDWNVEFYDSAWNILSDTESPPDGYPDTNRISPGSEVLIRMNVTIPATATPGDIDTKVFTARSSNDVSVSESVDVDIQTPFSLPFFDDVESGPGSWVSTPYWHIVHNETFGAAWNISYSGEYAWWYGRDVTGSYEDGFRNYGNLTSPPIDLTDSVAAEASFRYWYETENSMIRDERWLIIRTGNNPWPSAGQPGTIQLDLRDNRTWLEWRVNLTSYGGKIVQIRLFFDTVDSLDNDHQGWYIDDFNVTQTIARNTAPTVSIDLPAGGEVLSGGSTQTLEWTASDSTDPPSDMLLWANYSTIGGGSWLPIGEAQGIPADSAPINWTVPYENSTNMVVAATVVDSGGLWSSDWSEEFQIDSEPPQVAFYSPQGNNVRSTASIVLKFHETMNESSLPSSFSFVRTDTMEAVLGDIYTSIDSIFFDPLYNLDYGTEYLVTISPEAKDDSDPGNPLAQPFSWWFNTTTSMNDPPSITIVNPLGGESYSGGSTQQISWMASDSEDPTEILDVWLNYSANLSGPWTPIPTAQRIPADNTPLNWSIPLVNMTTVWINATIVDSRGLWNFSHSSTFEIDSDQPSISSRSPTGLTPAPTTIQITTTFSEGMNEFTAEAAFEMSRTDTGSPVAGAYDWQGSTMTFTPLSALSHGTWYRVEIEDIAMDDSIPGNSLVQNLSWLFQTESGDVTPPIVVSTHPENNQIDVPVDLRNITITFNESMHWLSVVNGLSITPLVSFGTSWSNTSLILILNEPLEYGRIYLVRINGSIAKDSNYILLDGNGDGSPGGDFLLYFTTEAGIPAEEPLDILPYMIGMLVAVVIILILLFLLKGREDDEEEEKDQEEEEETEEVDVEEELMGIEELLGIDKED
ncbi:MAG: Ig-like domain-containing protein [Thermoplasmata archaeon]